MPLLFNKVWDIHSLSKIWLSNQTVLGCECETSPTDSQVSTPGSQVVALFGEEAETLGSGAPSEEFEVLESDSAYSPRPVS